MNWPALAASQRRDAARRVPFAVDGRSVGSVDRAHLAALEAWPQWLRVTSAQVELIAAERDEALAHINTALHQQGLVRAWRDELFPLLDPSTGLSLARTERAACRFWGTLTRGAHANAYLADGHGRATHLWLARRSASKATDPGLLDNLIGGGVPAGQTPWETVIREGWEEAGLSPAQMAAAQPASVLRLQRDLPEGLQFEDLHCFDLLLPAGLQPHNQDGEVAAFDCLPVQQALMVAASSAMTVDAALVTLDFALRHRLLDPALADVLAFALPLRR